MKPVLLSVVEKFKRGKRVVEVHLRIRHADLERLARSCELPEDGDVPNLERLLAEKIDDGEDMPDRTHEG